MKQFAMEAETVLKKLFDKIPGVQKFQVEARTDFGFISSIQIQNNIVYDIYAIVLARAVPKAVFKEIEKHRESKEHFIIMAPYISEKSAKICEESGVGYCDFSGNSLISIDTIYISDKGNPNKYPKEDRAKTVFNPSARTTSLILRELMKDVTKVWRIKNLAETVGCSIGMVSRVKTYLCEQQWADMDQMGLRITAPDELMREWSKAYCTGETLNCYTLDQMPIFEKKCFKAYSEGGVDMCLSGFSGGVRYAPVVRYTKAHIWIDRADIEKFFELTGCKRVESGANITLLLADGYEVFTDCRVINQSRVASPVQVYLDCMQLKGRGEEMAEAVFMKEIQK